MGVHAPLALWQVLSVRVMSRVLAKRCAVESHSTVHLRAGNDADEVRHYIETYTIERCSTSISSEGTLG